MQGPVEGPTVQSTPSAPPGAPGVSPTVHGRPLLRMTVCAGPTGLSIALVRGAVPSILLALQIQRTVGEDAKVGALALVTTVGAVVAMVAQPVAGAVSDRTALGAVAVLRVRSVRRQTFPSPNLRTAHTRSTQ